MVAARARQGQAPAARPHQGADAALDAASLGVYWTVWGWKFAAGLVASIYVHEMGHVAALRRYGIAASAPMFMPGLGAFMRSKQ